MGDASDVTIRIARADEWEAYRDIRLATLRTDPDMFGSRYEDELERTEAWWRERVALPEGGATFVAEVDRRWVGTATGAPWDEVPATLGLFGMWVAPAWRGGGIGERLVRAVLAYAAETDVPWVQLLVAEHAGSARRLYERCGFQDIGERMPIRDVPGAWIGVVMRRRS
jgi:RimJ/RimL family protein N-acetyltransferase